MNMFILIFVLPCLEYVWILLPTISSKSSRWWFLVGWGLLLLLLLFLNDCGKHFRFVNYERSNEIRRWWWCWVQTKPQIPGTWSSECSLVKTCIDIVMADVFGTKSEVPMTWRILEGNGVSKHFHWNPGSRNILSILFFSDVARDFITLPILPGTLLRYFPTHLLC